MGQDRRNPRTFDLLTPREREIAGLVAEHCLSDQAIADELSISVSTVRAHLAAIGLKIPGQGRTKLKIVRWWHGTNGDSGVVDSA